jgi:tRNA(Met) cytidine acetyltransferase
MSLIQFGDALRRRAAESRHRYLVLVIGERDWGIKATFDLLGPIKATWISNREIAGTDTIEFRHALSLLGCETKSVVYDGGHQIDPDALGIVSGTIAGGGLMILLAPQIDQWHTAQESKFTDRIFRILSKSSLAVRVIQHQPIPDIEQLKKSVQQPANLSSISGPAATLDQQRAIDAIHAVIKGQRKRPAILVANRGRGKSAALGIVAGQLANQGIKNIVITGRSRQSVQEVFHHAAIVASHCTPRLRWLEIDQLLTQKAECDLLLVDEAASVHLNKLGELLKRYPRIAMATTVHGYEGTGRGFMLRFQHLLERYTRGWKHIQLDAPIRWSKQDPLEKLVNHLLVLDAELPEISAKDMQQEDIQIEEVNADALLGNEHLLREIFSLMVLAHYKTRPKDLQQLLDNGSLRIYRMALNTGSNEHTVGVAVLVDEGALSSQQAAQIFNGMRRPAGHVLPEIMASQLGLPHAATLSMIRIMRIVVHPTIQRFGLGSRLIRHVCDDSASHYDLIGSNFSVSKGLAKFWNTCGFKIVRIGETKTAQGGSNSAVYLMPYSGAGQEVFNQARISYARNFLDQLKTVLRDLEPELVAELVEGDGLLVCDPDQQFLADAVGYCYGTRPAESIPATLGALALNGLISNKIGDFALVVERVLQGKHWNECQCLEGEQGRRQGSGRLRVSIASYLEIIYGERLEAIRLKLIEGNYPER